MDCNRAAESGWANSNGFYQPDLEATLEELAVATAGVTLHRGWTFQALTQDDEGVSVELAVTAQPAEVTQVRARWLVGADRSEEHTSELQSHLNLVCRLLLEKK